MLKAIRSLEDGKNHIHLEKFDVKSLSDKEGDEGRKEARDKLLQYIDRSGEHDYYEYREGEDRTIKFSLRAKEPDCVSDIAQQFGGGGHPQAAGITMYGKLDETAGSVLDALIHKLNG